MLLLSFMLLVGCSDEKKLVSASDLARALNFVPAQLELPRESYENQELYFFVKETSDGRSDWFSAFQAPTLGGTVKFLANTLTNEIKILVDDIDSKSTYTVALKSEKYSRSAGWPTGKVNVENYVLRFAETAIGLTASDPHFQSFVDEETQKEADSSSWVRYRLVSASNVHEDAPLYIHQSIEQVKQIQSERDNG